MRHTERKNLWLFGTPCTRAQFAVVGQHQGGGGVLAWAEDEEHAQGIFKELKADGGTNLQIEIAPGGDCTGTFIEPKE